MAPPAPSVLLLSALVGRAVHVDGRPVGRVVDLVVDLADEDGAGEPIALPRIVAAVVQEGRRAAERSVPWGAVDRVEPEALVLLPRDEAATSPVEPGEQQLRLGRDVLDAQVFVFEGGGRMARVSDVLLAAEGQRGELQVVGVDVGFGAVCRRLGLHRLADRFGDEVIGWHQIHLASRSGHRVALLASRSSVHRVDAAQLAPLIDALASDPAAAVLEAVDPAVAASVVTTVHSHVAERVVRALSPGAVDRVLGELPPDEGHRLRRARGQRLPPRRRYLRHRSWRRRPIAGSRSGDPDLPDGAGGPGVGS